MAGTLAPGLDSEAIQMFFEKSTHQELIKLMIG